MSDRSIEFQEIKEDTSLPQIVRKSFRIPIEDKKSAWAVINKKRYPVLDICQNGIGIDLGKDMAFTVKEALLNCELNIFDISFKELNGRIVHLTSTKEEKWQCGIQWVDMEKETAEQMSGIVSKMKSQLLKDESISFD